MVSLLSVHRFRLVVVALPRRPARTSGPLRTPAAAALAVVVAAGRPGAAGALMLRSGRRGGASTESR